MVVKKVINESNPDVDSYNSWRTNLSNYNLHQDNSPI